MQKINRLDQYLTYAYLPGELHELISIFWQRAGLDFWQLQSTEMDNLCRRVKTDENS